MEENTIQTNLPTLEESKFTGGMLANFFIGLLTLIVSVITLGLAYPAMVCWKLRWRADHTYLNGRQLTFDGRASQLFGKFVLWMFLSVITLGLYYIFSVNVKLAEWETKHTHFAYYRYDENNNQSRFTGKWHQLLVVNVICAVVAAITLGFGYYWAHCYRERWYCHHKTIDGCDLSFNGTGMQYFGKRMLWTLLTFITLGIYVLWLQIKSRKWTVSHTNLLNMPAEENFLSAEELAALPPAPVMSKQYKMSIAGFVISILALLFLFIPTFSPMTNHLSMGLIMCLNYLNISITIFFGIIAAYVSFRARKKCDVEEKQARSFALAGIIIGVVVIALAVMSLFSATVFRSLLNGMMSMPS